MPFEQPVLDEEPAGLNAIIEHAPLSHTDPSHSSSDLSLDINRQLFQEETPVPDFPAPHMPVLSEEYFQLALKFQELGGGKVQEFVRTGSYELELPCTRFPLSHADVLICRLQPPTKVPRSIQRQRRERSVSVWMLARALPSKSMFGRNRKNTWQLSTKPKRQRSVKALRWGMRLSDWKSLSTSKRAVFYLAAWGIM